MKVVVFSLKYGININHILMESTIDCQLLYKTHG